MYNYSTSSGEKTTSVQISSIGGALCGVDITPPLAGQAVLTIYDSENSTLTNKLILAEVTVDAGMLSVAHEFFVPVASNRGIYADLQYLNGASGSKYIIRYILG